MANGFTQSNMIECGYTDEQIADMNAQLLELMPNAFDDDADENVVAYYCDQIAERGPRI